MSFILLYKGLFSTLPHTKKVKYNVQTNPLLITKMRSSV